MAGESITNRMAPAFPRRFVTSRTPPDSTDRHVCALQTLIEA